MISYAAVLTLGAGADVGPYVGLFLVVSSLLMALCGVSISIIYPPSSSENNLMREYTLFVSFEMLSFVLAYGLLTCAKSHVQGWTALPPCLLWLALQARLLLLACRETGETERDAWTIFFGTLAGILLWIAFIGLCRLCFAQAQTESGSFWVLVDILILTPVAACLAFVFSATLVTPSPSLLSWARACTAYLITLPVLLSLTMIVLSVA